MALARQRARRAPQERRRARSATGSPHTRALRPPWPSRNAHSSASLNSDPSRGIPAAPTRTARRPPPQASAPRSTLDEHEHQAPGNERRHRSRRGARRLRRRARSRREQPVGAERHHAPDAASDVVDARRGASPAGARTAGASSSRRSPPRAHDEHQVKNTTTPSSANERALGRVAWHAPRRIAAAERCSSTARRAGVAGRRSTTSTPAYAKRLCTRQRADRRCEHAMTTASSRTGSASSASGAAAPRRLQHEVANEIGAANSSSCPPARDLATIAQAAKQRETATTNAGLRRATNASTSMIAERAAYLAQRHGVDGSNGLSGELPEDREPRRATCADQTAGARRGRRRRPGESVGRVIGRGLASRPAQFRSAPPVPAGPGSAIRPAVPARYRFGPMSSRFLPPPTAPDRTRVPPRAHSGPAASAALART